MADCPNCALPVGEGDRFCESCGAEVTVDSGRLSSRSTAYNCGSCGGTVGGHGYCDACGRRQPVGRDRCELDLGTVAAVTDVGRHRARNEDAIAVGVVRGHRVAVVCDGVSSSPNADAAAHAAADAALDTLLRLLADGTAAEAATVAAFRAAERAVATLDRSGAGDAPACTFVSAVVTGERTVTIGWAGDSRAYWWADGGPETARCLTVDDSLAGQLGAAGVDPSRLSLSADAFGLTRWLGADAPSGDPHLVTFSPPGDGAVVLCSDGLSRYLPTPDALAHPFGGTAGPARTVANRLTSYALDAGGADNIAVAVLPVPVPHRRGEREQIHDHPDPDGSTEGAEIERSDRT
ncbi:protein phosphatase 2C domain-containing protein [Micromonospora sp. NPDC050397]|uniref:protein phosphatase 2C domain-containing protein n=1 Tax=Micromonospora sp. NPDC050397 TaxID=3364279 RepID=UPI00384F2179